MWTWTLNWNEIRHDLIVGSCPVEVDDLMPIRNEAGATAVLCVQSDECLAHFGIDYATHRRYAASLGLAMKRAPMRDFDVEDQRSRLPEAVRSLNGLLSEGHRVYVHCTAGLGRSPLVLVAYLTLVEGMPAAEAFAWVTTRRPGAVPSPEALEACRSDLLRASRADVERRAWFKYRERSAAHRRANAEADWLEAERDALRALLAPDPSPSPQPGGRGE